MTMKMRIAVTFTILASLLAAWPVFAAAPLDLHIEVEEYLFVSGEPFAASGAAVDAGVICAVGTVDDLSFAEQGSSPGFRILHIEKGFTCGDGSGTFSVSMEVKLFDSGETTARWWITGGTGDYTNLRGRGSLVGTPITLGESILDVYDGSIQSPLPAAAPLELQIQAEETLVGNANDPFTASGAAVSAGVICATGTVYDLDFAINDNIPGFWILQVDKEFTCGDGSGTFSVSMLVRLNLTTRETTARWWITGGTDDYADLRGRGTLVGTPIIPGESILDVYNGSVQ